MAFFPKLTCYPPLDQLTVYPPHQKQINFTVIFETSSIVPPFPWEAFLCYKDISSGDDSSTEWSELELEKSLNSPLILGNSTSPTSQSPLKHTTFVGSLRLAQEEVEPLTRLIFTVKYRIDRLYRWYWLKFQDGIDDGEILIQSSSGGSKLSSYIELDSFASWTTTSLTSHDPGVRTFKLDSHKLAASGGPISATTKIIGTVIGQQRFLALVNMPEPWLFPRHGRESFYIPEDATICCFLGRGGQAITLLGLSGFDCVHVQFQSTHDNKISAKMRNDGSKAAHAQIVVAVASSVDASIAAAVSAAREILEESTVNVAASEEDQRNDYVFESTAESKQNLDDWYDGIAYCTWNSLGPELTTEKILSGLDSLREEGINVANLIIDDNWQDIGEGFDESTRPNQGWEDFEASKTHFPEGLKAAVSEIREKHPYVKDIAVWHALFGYWGGISPTGKLAEQYKTMKAEATLLIGHVVKEVTAIAPEDAHRFYDDFYTFLSSCGITAIKTDVQHMLGEWSDGRVRASFLETYPSAWTSAYLKHFKGKAISCMSMIPQNLLLNYLPEKQPRVMLRNSDDFFPEIASSHTRHIFTNAHNALFTRRLNILPDWDMFQTSHVYSAYHAAARCVSGGPIYITDKPGEHDVGLLKQMVARSPRGKTIALRPTSLGRAVNPWNDFHEGQVLKVGSYTGSDHDGTSILGLFNVAEKEVTCVASLLDFPASDDQIQSARNDPKSKVLVRSYVHDQIFPPVSRISTSPNALIYTNLPIRGYDILYIHPIHHLTHASTFIDFAILGLVRKMTGPAAVSSLVIEAADDESRIKIRLKALGTLGIWVKSKAAFELFSSHMTCTLQGQEIAETLIEFEGSKGKNDDGEDDDEDVGGIIRFDLLSFWEDSPQFEDEGLDEIEVCLVLGQSVSD